MADKNIEIRRLLHQGKEFYPLVNAKSIINSNGDSIDIVLRHADIKLLEGYSYEGQAMLDTVPEKFELNSKVFYIAVTKGIYNNFKNSGKPINIEKDGTWAIKYSMGNWYLEELMLSTTTDKIYDEITDSYIEESLITSDTEGYLC